MNKRRVIAVLLICWIGLTSLKDVRAEEPSIPMDQSVPLGERLVYKISWLGIPIGVGELWVREKTTLDGREVIHAAGLIETNKFLSKIFPMHDEAHSWIDAETLESVQFEKKIDELRIKEHERMTFDGARGKGYFESFKTGEKKEFDVMAPVHDVLSVVFWARRQDLTLGDSLKTVVSVDQKNWFLEIDAVERETVKLDGKRVETLRVEPNTVVEGVERRGKAWIDLTLDSSRTPVRIVYKAPFGRVVGTLQKDKSQTRMRREPVLKAKN